jgi:hypothetical protein
MFRERSGVIALFVLSVAIVVVLSSFVMAVKPVKNLTIQFEGYTYTFPSETLNIKYGPTTNINSVLTSANKMIPIRVCKGDINLDGKINGFDVDPFVALLTNNWSENLSEREELLFWLGDLNSDGVISFADIDPFVDVLTGEAEPTCISWPIIKLYDFVHEEDIKAYQCRLGPHPLDFPDIFNAEICNREFLEMTNSGDLDIPDKIAFGGDAWTNYATHHFFVLENVDGSKLRRFAVGFVSMNKYYNGKEHHYLYVKNFATNEWEVLSEALVARNKQGFMGHISNFGDKSDYVNEENEMWFMGTEGQHSGKAIGSDAFAVLLRFRIFGVESLDQNLAPDWMAYVFE